MTARGGPLVLAVDIGSSSVRAGLYDARAVARRGTFAQVSYAPQVDGDGGVSVEPERLIEVLRDTLDEAVVRAGDDVGRIVAAGTSCFLHSVAALDDAGRPITPLLTWADTTSVEASDELRAAVDPAAVWAATGAPIHAAYWPAKVIRLRAVTDGRARRFAGAPELVWQALTGRAGVDLSLASGTGLLDRSRATWDASLLGFLALSPEELPAIVPPRASAMLSGWAADRWPSLGGIPWFAPWSDAWCGNVGLGAVEEGRAALQVGTSGAVRLIRAEPVPPVPPGLFAHRLPDGTSLVGGQLSEGGGVAAAVARLVGSTPRRLDPDAAALPPDGHGLTLLPFLAGERGPGYDARARGAVDGLTLATTPAELYLATVEAIALRFAHLDAALTGQLGRAPEVVASGGAVARSALLPGILAGALGRPIRLSDEGEASARGAAILALVGAGLIEAVGSVEPPPSREIVPDPARVTAYALAGQRQAALYEALRQPRETNASSRAGDAPRS